MAANDMKTAGEKRGEMAASAGNNGGENKL
jgi:hypothetical protein